MRIRLKLAASLLCTVLGSFGVQATPYASSVQVAGTNGSFVLNEGADSIIITYGDNTTQTISAPTAGVQTFTLPSAASPYSIAVYKNGAAGFSTVGAAPGTTSFGTATKLQVSSDSNANLQFGSPRGVGINYDPSSNAFGRIYVSNSTSAAGLRGIFALNADGSGALGAGARGPSNGSISFAASTNSPNKLHVGSDGTVYISDFADANGGLFQLDKNLNVPSSGTFALAGISGTAASVTAGANHGNPEAFGIFGSSAAGTLRINTIDEDYTNTSAGIGTYSVLQYNVGTTPNGGYTAQPSKVVNQPFQGFNPTSADLAVANNGNIYITQFRAGGTDKYSLGIFKPDGTQVYDSLSASLAYENTTVAGGGADFFRNTISIALSPDNTMMALGRVDGLVYIVPLLADGTPDLSKGSVLNAFTNATTNTNFYVRSVAFDLAGNLYATQVNDIRMRIFSPGGTTVATTMFDGANYGFSVVPEPTLAGAFLVAFGALSMRRRPRGPSIRRI